MPQARWTLSLGGVRVVLDCSAVEGRADILPVYHPFASQGEPEIRIRVQPGRLTTGLQPDYKIFQAGPNWSLHSHGEQFIITTRSEQAVCSPDFREIDLILPEQTLAQQPAFFFAYPLSELIMISFLARNHGLVLHACGVKEEGEVRLFCGMSGAGKSTLATLWAKEKTCSVLSDDRIIVRQSTNGFRAYGTPWHGEAGHSEADSGPLGRLFFIEHGSENRCTQVSPGQAAAWMVSRSFPPLWDRQAMAACLDLVEEIIEQVECRAVQFRPEPAILDFVRNQ